MDRPPELMSDRELVRALDQADADLARIETRRLRLVAALDKSGYAEEIGARDTVQFLEYRYRLDHSRARRDVRLARALPKYVFVSAALPDTNPDTGPDTGLDPDAGLDADPDTGTDAGLDADPDTGTDAAPDTDAGPDTAESAGDQPVMLRPAQAEPIVTVLEKVPTNVPVADLEVAERELVRLAKQLPPAELRKAAERVRDILDTDGPEPKEHEAYTRESLTLTPADRGVKFRGYLANENAELLRSLIVAAARPHKTADGEPDPRSREKRQADALTTTLTLAATALDAGTFPNPTPADDPAPDTATHHTTKPDTAHTPATYTGADTGTAPGGGPGAATGAGPSGAPSAGPGGAPDGSCGGGTDGALGAGSSGAPSAGADAGTDGAPGAGVGGASDGGADGGRRCGVVGRSRGAVVPGFGAKANITVTIDLEDLRSATADAIGTTVHSGGLSAAAIRRLACDANVIPVVLGSNSEPLDVGRRERLVTRAMRRALNTRDRGCVVCGAPPVMCDAHHLVSWIDGGVTAVSNLVLLCRRHHVDLHNGHWTISITNGTVHVTRPQWADPPNPRQRHHRDKPTSPPTPPPPPSPPTPSPPPSPAPQPRSGTLGRNTATSQRNWSAQATDSAPHTTKPHPAHTTDPATRTAKPRPPHATEPTPRTAVPPAQAQAQAQSTACPSHTEVPGTTLATPSDTQWTNPTGTQPANPSGAHSANPSGAHAGNPSGTHWENPSDTRSDSLLTGASAAGDPAGPLVPRSRWKADEAILRQAAEFALIDTPAN